MGEDVKEEMNRLKEEMANLRNQLKEMTERRREKGHGIYIDLGERVQDYVEDVMEGVAEGIQGELDRSVFVGPAGVRITRRREKYRRDNEEPVDFPKVAGVMSALGNEHRLKVMSELMSGGKYINELQEQFSEITTSTLSSHLNVLEETGLVVQEKMRGRYLITIPGRAAYKMTKRVMNFLERSDQE